MAPLAQLLQPVDLWIGKAVFLPAYVLLSVIAYYLVKLAYSTFIGHYFAPLRDLPGPIDRSFWAGALPEAFEQEPGITFNRWVRKYGGAIRFKTLVGNDALLLSDPFALNHVLLSNPYGYVKPEVAGSSASDIVGHGLFTAEGEDHRRQRKIMTPAFSMAHLREYTYVIFDKTRELSDQWRKIVEESVVEEAAFKCPEKRREAQEAVAPNEAVIEVNSWLSALTLDVIGLIGFGHNFDTLSSKSSVLSSAYKCMSTRVKSKNSAFKLLRTQVFLWMKRVGRAVNVDVARWIPDPRMQADRKLRKTLEEESRRIMLEKREAIKIEGEESLQDSKDLIARLIRASSGEDAKSTLSGEELRGALMTFLLVGHETTSNQLGIGCTYYLARYPQVQKKLRDELRAAQEEHGGQLDWQAVDKLEYLDAVVHELLRCEPVAPLTWREAIADDVVPLGKPVESVRMPGKALSHLPIRKGQQIMFPLYAMNRNPELYGEDAEEFRPERWLEIGDKKIKGTGLYNLMTFFNGARGCIGYNLAIMEIKIALAVLVPVFSFAPRDPDMTIERRAELVARPLIEGEKDLGPRMVLRVALAE
ncbi:hypothetical protein JCM10207_002686 [Rhodosporidiobolus poonsookiae]